MITLTALFTLLYGYSIYKIRKDSGSWKNFDPHKSNFFLFVVYMYGNTAIIISILGLLVYAAYSDIIP